LESYTVFLLLIKQSNQFVSQRKCWLKPITRRIPIKILYSGANRFCKR
jgi:hypothetical protein